MLCYKTDYAESGPGLRPTSWVPHLPSSPSTAIVQSTTTNIKSGKIKFTFELKVCMQKIEMIGLRGKN